MRFAGKEQKRSLEYKQRRSSCLGVNDVLEAHKFGFKFKFKFKFGLSWEWV